MSLAIKDEAIKSRWKSIHVKGTATAKSLRCQQVWQEQDLQKGAYGQSSVGKESGIGAGDTEAVQAGSWR